MASPLAAHLANERKDLTTLRKTKKSRYGPYRWQLKSQSGAAGMPLTQEPPMFALSQDSKSPAFDSN